MQSSGRGGKGEEGRRLTRLGQIYVFGNVAFVIGETSYYVCG